MTLRSLWDRFVTDVFAHALFDFDIMYFTILLLCVAPACPGRYCGYT